MCSWRQHRWRVLGSAITAAAAAVLLASCGGGGSGSPAASSSSPGSGSTAFQQALALARCARAHGAPDFPDPNSDGSFPAGRGDLPPSAVSACAELIQAQKQSHLAQMQQDYPRMLQVARCVRAHGYPTFPDPPAPGSQPQATGNPAGIDVNSPQFQAVLSSCNKQYPGSSGSGTAGPPGSSVTP
jgi:hypothetical protein